MNGILYRLVISAGIALFRAMYEPAIDRQVLALHQSHVNTLPHYKRLSWFS
jgi:hypothetical protein